MSLVLRSVVTKNSVFSYKNANTPLSACLFTFYRRFSDEHLPSNPQYSSSTILIENGYNVQELPVVVRKLKNISEIDEKHLNEPERITQDSLSYQLIHAEFKQCLDLKDVFSLLSKCTKITPNIALGAVERIYDLEKDLSPLTINNQSNHINLAKGAILDKLVKVILKTEDTQTILNILNSSSSFMEPYKYKFSDELLCRVIDKKLSIEQLCNFTNFLIKNKSDSKYSETIDKLWVGFMEREADINNENIGEIFNIINGLKASKKTILLLMEEKLTGLWNKINVNVMQGILNTFIEEKYLTMQSFAVVGSWLHSNIHALDEDSLLDIIVKLTCLKYTDDQIQRAIEKYMKLKSSKIEKYVLIVGILNYCMQFQICNERILNGCCEYFLTQGNIVPASFLKSIIYPFGFLDFEPARSQEFWQLAEQILNLNYYKIPANDLSLIVLSFIYSGRYPMKTITRMFNSEYILKIDDSETMKKLYLIDMALSLECPEYTGPLLPKDQWSGPVPQDKRVTNIVNKIFDTFLTIVGSPEKLSTNVLIPHIYSDETYLIDIMLHPVGLGSNNYNWKSKIDRNMNIAVLIHLPDHYCSDNKRLIGPQLMRRKHIRILGFKVVSLKYSVLSQYYTSFNMNGLRQYIVDSIDNAEPCL